MHLRPVLALGIATISCSAIGRLVPGSASPFPSLTPPPTSTSTPTLAPPAVIPPECAGVPLATVPAATTIALPTPAAGSDPALDTTEQLAVFDELIAAIEADYLYPDYNGVDFPGLRDLARSEIAAGLETEAFYREIDTFLQALGDEHSHFESPAEVAASEAELAGGVGFVGVGVLVQPLEDKQRVTILVVFPGSPAEAAGLRSHDSLLAVDGLPIVEDGVAHTQRVRGPECSAVVLTVQSPGGEPRRIQLVRHRFGTSAPVVADRVPTADGSRIGYIFLPTFFDRTVPGEVQLILEEFGELDGLILDNRMNGGGSSDVVEAILAFFTSGTLGHFVSRESERPLTVIADPVANSQSVPLVVLVGEHTASFGEIFSGVLQDSLRAQVAGQTTSGNVEILSGYEFSDGSNAWIAAESFRPLYSGADWEAQGIIPMIEVSASWDAFTFETDPGIAAALRLLGH